MKNHRNAVLWAIGWWIVRRQIRRRAAAAVADVTAARRGRLRAVVGAVLLVGLLATAMVAARKLLAGGDALEAPLPEGPPGPPDAAPIESLPDTAPA